MPRIGNKGNFKENTISFPDGSVTIKCDTFLTAEKTICMLERAKFQILIALEVTKGVNKS